MPEPVGRIHLDVCASTSGQPNCEPDPEPIRVAVADTYQPFAEPIGHHLARYPRGRRIQHEQRGLTPLAPAVTSARSG